jgi:hypothetical protein
MVFWMCLSMWHHLGIERFGIYFSLPNVALFILVFLEVLSRLLIFFVPILLLLYHWVVSKPRFTWVFYFCVAIVPALEGNLNSGLF